MSKALDLLNMSRDQAERNLDDDELERWKELNSAKQHAEDFYEDSESGLQHLIDNAQNEMTERVELFGTDIKVDTSYSVEQEQLLKEMESFRGMDEEELLEEGKKDVLIEKILEFLAVSTDSSKDEWRDVLQQTGYNVLKEAMERVVQPITKKQESVEKFRS